MCNDTTIQTTPGYTWSAPHTYTSWLPTPITVLLAEKDRFIKLYYILLNLDDYSYEDNHTMIIMSYDTGTIYRRMASTKPVGFPYTVLAHFKGGIDYTEYNSAIDLFNQTARKLNPEWQKDEPRTGWSASGP